MPQVILDTSFILSCIRNRIDFFEDLKFVGLQIIIPQQVIDELKKLKAELALKILGKEKKSFKIVKLKSRNVDRGLISFAESNQDFIVATLDREIKKKIRNHKLVIRGKKRLEIV